MRLTRRIVRASFVSLLALSALAQHDVARAEESPVAGHVSATCDTSLPIWPAPVTQSAPDCHGVGVGSLTGKDNSGNPFIWLTGATFDVTKPAQGALNATVRYGDNCVTNLGYAPTGSIEGSFTLEGRFWDHTGTATLSGSYVAARAGTTLAITYSSLVITHESQPNLDVYPSPNIGAGAGVILPKNLGAFTSCLNPQLNLDVSVHASLDL